MIRLTDTFRPFSMYDAARAPIYVDADVVQRLRNLMGMLEFDGTGVGFSAFIDRACEVAETEIMEARGRKGTRA